MRFEKSLQKFHGSKNIFNKLHIFFISNTTFQLVTPIVLASGQWEIKKEIVKHKHAQKSRKAMRFQFIVTIKSLTNETRAKVVQWEINNENIYQEDSRKILAKPYVAGLRRNEKSYNKNID